MSTWKLNKSERSGEADEQTAKAAIDADNPPAAKLDVDVLEIDVDSEVDCDPYNRTGQFCVATFDKRDK